MVNQSPSSTSTKLRLMCSYGGQIVPRTHDNALCYAGGETRIVAVDSRIAGSFSALTAHLSRALFGGRPFVLKYQLPNHDLDSLVSIACDEDLANMLDEYDQVCSSRLRFFLFPLQFDSDSSDYDPKSEEWFFDTLRSANMARGKAVSGEKSLDSNSVDGLGDSEGKCGGAVDGFFNQGAGKGPESILLDNLSSFGSAGSSASVFNSPEMNGVRTKDVGGLQTRQDVEVITPLADSAESDSIPASTNIESPTNVYLDSLCITDTKEPKEPSNRIDAECKYSGLTPRANELDDYPSPQPNDWPQQLHPPPAQLHQTYQQQQPVFQTYPQPNGIFPGSHFITQYYQPGAFQGPSHPTMYQSLPQYHHQNVPYQPNRTYHQVYLVPMVQTQPNDTAFSCNLTGHQMAGPAPTHYYPLSSNPNTEISSPVTYDGFAVAQSEANTPYRVVQPAGYVGSELQQHPLMAVSQMPQQPLTSSVAEGSSYSMGRPEDPLFHPQMYKNQGPAPGPSSHFQPVTDAAATLRLSENFAQQVQLEGGLKAST